MSHRSLALVLVLAMLGILLWRHELFTVQRPGDRPRDLESIEIAQRGQTAVDAVLPVVPIGMRRVRAGAGAVLIYYWAPWLKDAFAQAAALDSLRRVLALETLDIEIVCFDPFPSVARYVARQRLALPVLLDTRGDLRAQLPCPSMPFTYVLDAAGRIAVRQPGQVDWLSPGTRTTLVRLAREAAGNARAAPAVASAVNDRDARGTEFVRKTRRRIGASPDSAGGRASGRSSPTAAPVGACEMQRFERDAQGGSGEIPQPSRTVPGIESQPRA